MAAGNTSTYETIWTLLTKANTKDAEDAYAKLNTTIKKTVGEGNIAEGLSRGVKASTEIVNTWGTVLTETLAKTTARVKEANNSQSIFFSAGKIGYGALSDAANVSLTMLGAKFKFLGTLLGAETLPAMVAVGTAFVGVTLVLPILAAGFYASIAAAADQVRGLETLKASLGGIKQQASTVADAFENMASRASYKTLGSNFEGWVTIFSSIGGAGQVAFTNMLSGAVHAIPGVGELNDALKDGAEWLDEWSAQTVLTSDALKGLAITAKGVATNTSDVKALNAEFSRMGIIAGTSAVAVGLSYEKLRVGTNNAAIAFASVALASEAARVGGKLFIASEDELATSLADVAVNGGSLEKVFTKLGLKMTDSKGLALDYFNALDVLKKHIASLSPEAAKTAQSLVNMLKSQGDPQITVIERNLKLRQAAGIETLADEQQTLATLTSLQSTQGEKEIGREIELLNRRKALQATEDELTIGAAIQYNNTIGAIYGNTQVSIKATGDLQREMGMRQLARAGVGTDKGLKIAKELTDGEQHIYQARIQAAESFFNAKAALAEQGVKALDEVGNQSKTDFTAVDRARITSLDAQIAKARILGKEMRGDAALANQRQIQDLQLQILQTARAAEAQLTNQMSTSYNTLANLAHSTGKSFQDQINLSKEAYQVQIDFINKRLSSEEMSAATRLALTKQSAEYEMQKVEELKKAYGDMRDIANNASKADPGQQAGSAAIGKMLENYMKGKSNQDIANNMVLKQLAADPLAAGTPELLKYQKSIADSAISLQAADRETLEKIRVLAQSKGGYNEATQLARTFIDSQKGFASKDVRQQLADAALQQAQPADFVRAQQGSKVADFDKIFGGVSKAMDDVAKQQGGFDAKIKETSDIVAKFTDGLKGLNTATLDLLTAVVNSKTDRDKNEANFTKLGAAVNDMAAVTQNFNAAIDASGKKFSEDVGGAGPSFNAAIDASGKKFSEDVGGAGPSFIAAAAAIDITVGGIRTTVKDISDLNDRIKAASIAPPPPPPPPPTSVHARQLTPQEIADKLSAGLAKDLADSRQVPGF